jgi:iron complex outermembrane recepter protein
MKNIRASHLAIGVALAIPQMAMAQQAAAPQAEQASPPEQASQEASVGVGDIVVTAQRRSENLQRVPIAVTALSSEKLESTNVNTTAGLANVTPALTLSATVGFLQPRIRGVGNSSAGPAVENSVATYIDGVYISSAPGTLLSLGNIERVEVLKGPQGTLFGRNATAGLINVITADPGDHFAGKAHLGYGNYQTLDGDLYLSGPISDGIRADIAIAGTTQGKGYGTNLFTGHDTYQVKHNIGARTKWLFDLGDTTRARLEFDITDEKSSVPSPGEISGTAPAAYKDANGNPIIVNLKPRDLLTNDDPYHTNLTYGGSFKLEQDVGFGTITSLTAYRRMNFKQAFDADSSPVPLYYQTYTQKDRQFSQELQLASSSGGPLQWIIGGYYFNFRGAYDPLQTAIGPVATRSYNILRDTLRTESFAGFVQATYEIARDTRLTGGFRYTTERRTIEGSVTGISAAGATTVTPLPNTPAFKSNTPTWRISLDHNFDPNIMAYASWNRGFKSGGFNGQAPTQPAYQPEYLDAYEVGLKSKLLDNRVRLNLAAFLYDYRDIQVNTYIGSLGVIYNGAKARTWGLDADLEVAATDNLTISGGVTALHDRFTNFPAAAVATPVGNGLVTIAPGSATGNRLPYAPDVTFSLGALYKVDVGGDKTLEISASNLHSTGFYTQPDNYYRQRPYDMLNASLTLRTNDRKFSAKLWVNNLFNEDVLTIASASSGFQFSSFQAPRTFGITFGSNF